MGLIERIITQFEPIDTHEKVDALIEMLKEKGVPLDDALNLKIKFKISKQVVLRYYLAKYFGLTTGEQGSIHPHQKHNKKIYYGCSDQDDLIKKNKEERRKRLKTTNEEWRKQKHKLPIVEDNTTEGVKYIDRAKIIYTPMGGKNK